MNKYKNMNYDKIVRKIRHLFVSRLYKKRYYFYLYNSYRKTLLAKQLNICNQGGKKYYISAKPNYGAGIGHQLANWISGYYYSKFFGIEFAHYPFSNDKWDEFLGFYKFFESVEELDNQKFKIVRLPYFIEANKDDVEKIREIINTYPAKSNVLFMLEQDQFYKSQIGVIDELKYMYKTTCENNKRRSIINNKKLSISIHVRRGDIAVDNNSAKHMANRWSANDYYCKVLDKVLSITKKMDIPTEICLFSQGKQKDFKEFEKYDIRYCLDVDAITSFYSMSQSKILITSKSSFSYNPALFSLGIKIVPEDFWHDYPKEEEWIIANDDGVFEQNRLEKLLINHKIS